MVKRLTGSDKRPTKRVHVYLFEDQLEEIMTLWPQTNLSHVVRTALDRTLEKAREKIEEISLQQLSEEEK